jgi:hypothetical protein
MRFRVKIVAPDSVLAVKAERSIGWLKGMWARSCLLGINEGTRWGHSNDCGMAVWWLELLASAEVV